MSKAHHIHPPGRFSRTSGVMSIGAPAIKPVSTATASPINATLSAIAAEI